MGRWMTKTRRWIVLVLGSAGAGLVVTIVLAVALSFVLDVAPGAAQREGHAFSPQSRTPNEELLRQLKLPSGFRIDLFASGLGGPRMMAVGDDGTVYVTRPRRGDVLALQDRNGRAEGQREVTRGLSVAHGITIHGGRMYLAGERKVIVAEMRADGSFGEWRTLIEDLPPGGHDKRTIGIGPDGRLYISVGSTCNACKERDREQATLLVAREDGRERRVFASGLRNTIGFGWHPETRELFGMDHGSDWRGDDQPPEKLNQLVEGGNYGWPYCIRDRQPDPFMDDPAGMTKAAYCAKTRGPALMYQAHSAPIAMLFYTGRQFPADYRGDAFVAFHGSWNRQPASGYEVVRVRFDHGKPVRFEPFLSGFLTEGGTVQFGRPAGLAVARDGALLVSDDAHGMIYRVSYQASASR